MKQYFLGRIMSFLLCVLSLTKLNAQAQPLLSPLDSVLQTLDWGSDSLHNWFDWVITHVDYDAHCDLSLLPPDSIDRYVNYAIQHGSGICHHYASLFVVGAQRLGYQAQIITGLASPNAGRQLTAADRHSWCAVKDRSGWFLYDPTWAAGFVDEQLIFHKKPNYRWYHKAPTQFSDRHLAFNPIWSPSSLAHPQADSIIAAFEAMSETQQLDFLIKGLSSYPASSATQEELNQLHIMRNSFDLDLANFYLNHAIQLHNDFSYARHRLFRRPKWSRDSIIQHVSHIRMAFDSSLTLFQGASSLTPGMSAYQQQSIAYALEIEQLIQEDERLVARYRKARRPFRFLVLIP